MAAIVYILCAVTAAAVAVLLLRGYARTRTKLLLWAAVCFSLLTLNNVLLVADRVVFLEVDMTFFRSATQLLGVSALAYGLLREAS